MATDRSTDDYKKLLAAATHGLLQNPTPQNKMDILAADAVTIADKLTAALADAVAADQEEDAPSKGPATPSTPSAPSTPSTPAPSPAPSTPSIPPPPTGK